MFKRLRIKNYLQRCFGLIIGLAVFSVFVAIVGLLLTNSAINTLVNKVSVSENGVRITKTEVNEVGRHLAEMSLSEDKSTFEVHQAAINESFETLNVAYVDFIGSYGQDETTDKFGELYGIWAGYTNEAIEYLNKGEYEKARSLILNECATSADDVLNIADDTALIVGKQMDSIVFRSRFIVLFFVCFMVVGCIGAVILSFRIEKDVVDNIVTALDKFSEAMQGLARGELDTRTDYEANNEFGELSVTFNNCLADLKKYVDSISESVDAFAEGNLTARSDLDFIGDFKRIQESLDEFQTEINGALYAIETSAQDVTDGTDAISMASQDLADGASDQSASVEELAATIGEMTEKIESTSEYMEQMQIKMQETINMVNEGNSKMDGVKDAMNLISERSVEIEGIVGTMNEITNQISLLALNASIEAARAGEAGRGFAVVADEVGNLANQSSEASSRIAELVTGTLEAVNNGTSRVDNAASSFQLIVGKSSEISEMVKEVSRVAEDESEGMRQISAGVDSIAEVVENNSATSVHTAESSQNLKSNTQVMMDAISKFQISR